MKLDVFDYSFPAEFIADHPCEERDLARLALVTKNECQHGRVFRDLPTLVTGNEVFVVNDTRVLPSRLLTTRKTGGQIEVFLLSPQQEQAPSRWSCLLRPAAKLRLGEDLVLEDRSTHVTVRSLPSREEDGNDRSGVVEFAGDAASVRELLRSQGHVPLPPYLRRPDQPADKDWYQTVYAETEGAVAAPTAGLHFTPELLTALKERGCQVVPVTLHVGLGTFAPVMTEDIEQHQMHAEWYRVSEQALGTIQQAYAQGREVVCVGTTSLRAVEAALAGPSEGFTSAFFYPGRPPQHVRSLITNFHQPRSTLLMLISSLLGVERTRQVYQEALDRKYRLFSYGDGMWIRTHL